MNDRFYGQYDFRAFKAIRSHGFSPKDTPWSILAMMAERGITTGSKEHDWIEAQCVYAGFRILEGEGCHIFIGSKAEKVIKNAVSKLTWGDIRHLVPPAVKNGIIYRTSGAPFMYSVEDCDGERETPLYLARKSDEGATWVTSPGVDDDENKLLTDITRLNDQGSIALLLIGTILMQKEFPGIFEPGPPLKVLHPSWYKKLKNVSHCSIMAKGGSVCPHVRSGHFRRLTSARFVNKRNQIIFVRPAMVKGEAEHTHNA